MCPENKDYRVKILVGYHKRAVLLKDSVLTPINEGRALLHSDYGERDWLLENTIGDDTGDNISAKNKNYNELTAIYWAWKNIDKIGNPDAIGFWHYRRHMIFNEHIKRKQERWTVDYQGYIGGKETYLNAIGYSENIVRKLSKQFPCIVGSYSGKVSVYQQYRNSEILAGHHIEDLDFVCEYIKENYPDYKNAVNAYINGKENYFGNIFILRKDLFERYCSFIFDVLNKFEEYIKKDELRSEWENRFFVSERITGIFITKLAEEHIAIKKVAVSLVENTADFIQPKINNDDVNIVFSIDRNYLPHLAVTLKSINDHLSPTRKYHAYILHVGISSDIQREFINNLQTKRNFQISFVDISYLFNKINKENLYIEIHVTKSTYYRFFIQQVFKEADKILYLDSDLIVLDDIAKLYDTDIGEKLLGVALDIRENLAAKLDIKVSKGVNWKEYIRNILKIKTYGMYFQAGVILFNLKKLKNVDYLNRCLNKLKEIKTPILSDQDVLNSEFCSDVFYIDPKWNVEWQILFEFPNYDKIMPTDLLLAYKQALRHPSIIHYASSVKPWNNINKPLAEYWWVYARSTIYYEQFFQQAINLIQKKNCKKYKCYKLYLYKLLKKATFGLSKTINKKYNKYFSKMQDINI
jgi:lipopolysaccharide biosynthesis glycosyltransferase